MTTITLAQSEDFDSILNKILYGILFTTLVAVGYFALQLDLPIASVSAAQLTAEPQWPSGPADPAVAHRYGRIDHAIFSSPDIPVEPNPGPAAIAAYESPPQ